LPRTWEASYQKTDLECREFMEVGCKQGGAADVFHEVLGDGPGQAKPVVSGRATPQLIDDDQGIAACTLYSIVCVAVHIISSFPDAPRFLLHVVCKGTCLSSIKCSSSRHDLP